MSPSGRPALSAPWNYSSSSDSAPTKPQSAGLRSISARGTRPLHEHQRNRDCGQELSHSPSSRACVRRAPLGSGGGPGARVPTGGASTDVSFTAHPMSWSACGWRSGRDACSTSGCWRPRGWRRPLCPAAGYRMSISSTRACIAARGLSGARGQSAVGTVILTSESRASSLVADDDVVRARRRGPAVMPPMTSRRGCEAE
jgi:hypothetical protein